MRDSRYKLKGLMLITTVVAVAAWILLAGGIFLTQSSQFQMLGARKIEEQARQYAEIDAQVLKYVPYAKLTDEATLKSYKLHTKRAKMETVEAADWEDEITFSEEKKSSDKSGGYRTATVNIYRKDDTKPRWSFDVILVKGAKNSSKTDTGEEPSDDDSESGDYDVFVIGGVHASGNRIFMGCVNYPGHSDDFGFLVAFAYRNKYISDGQVYPRMFRITIPILSQMSRNGFLNTTTLTLRPNVYNDWYTTYQPTIIEQMKQSIESKDRNIKFSSLHNGTGNAKLHFTLNYVVTGFDCVGRNYTRYGFVPVYAFRVQNGVATPYPTYTCSASASGDDITPPTRAVIDAVFK